MEKFSLYAARLLPKEEFLSKGHRACQGCGEALAVRLVCKAAGRNTIIANATGCLEIFTTPYPQTAWELPWMHVAFENTAAVASGIEAGIMILNKKNKFYKKPVNIIGMAGDGGTADIGLQALSGAWERGHNFLYVCYDNEAYMNTGIQRSSATPFGAATTTSPAGIESIGQPTWKKNMVAIAEAHEIPYAATACPSYPFDLIAKVKKALEIKGPAYLHIFSPCPTGWAYRSHLTIMIGRLAAETGIFPIYEIENGKIKFDIDPPKLKPVEEYLKLQGRFSHLTSEIINKIQKRVNEEYKKLKRKAKFQIE